MSLVQVSGQCSKSVSLRDASISEEEIPLSVAYLFEMTVMDRFD